MRSSAPPDPETALRLVPRALLGTSLALLVLGAVLNGAGRGADGPEIVSGVATAWAIVSPLLAIGMRGRGLVAPPSVGGTSDEPVAASVRAGLVFFAILETGVVLPAVALIVSRPQWPLVAALFPLFVMILNLPRRAA